MMCFFKYPNVYAIYIYIYLFIYLYLWRFPDMGVPLYHPYIDGFSTRNHPAIGVYPFVETLYGQ